MSSLSSAVSIFDITLIVDVVCQSLHYDDLLALRLANKQLLSICQTYVWNTLRLRSTLRLSDSRMVILQEQKSWIRSLAIAAQHVERVSRIGCTTLQELVVFDENFGCTYVGTAPVSTAAMISLIDNNQQLNSLEIDLNHYHFDFHTRTNLSPALLLAIYRHPTLSRLAWNIPDFHGSKDLRKFLLYVCQSRIRELIVCSKEFVVPPNQGYDDDDEYAILDLNSCWEFSWKDFNNQDRQNKELMDLKDKVLLSQVDGMQLSFALQKVRLFYYFHPEFPDLLRNAPDLQYVELGFAEEVRRKALGILAAQTPHLKVLNLQSKWDKQDYSPFLVHFSHLEGVYLNMVDDLLCALAIEALVKSGSRDSIRLLGFSKLVPVSGIVHALKEFPNLQLVDLGDTQMTIVKMRRKKGGGGGGGDPIQSPAQHFSMDIATRWYPDVIDRPLCSISGWLVIFEVAYRMCSTIHSEWVLASAKRQAGAVAHVIISFKFMLPIREYLPEDVAKAYTAGSCDWLDERGCRRVLTIDDVRYFVSREEEAMMERK